MEGPFSISVLKWSCPHVADSHSKHMGEVETTLSTWMIVLGPGHAHICYMRISVILPIPYHCVQTGRPAELCLETLKGERSTVVTLIITVTHVIVVAF